MIHICAVATEEKFYMKWLKESCLRNNCNLTVLGMGEKFENYMTKILIFQKFLFKLNDNDIVCFVDAYDVIMLENISYLEKEFLKFERKNPDMIVISEESKYLLGNLQLSSETWSKIIMKLFNYDSFDFYANSGGLIGRVNNLKKVWDQLVILSEDKKIIDDQACIIEYMKTNPGVFYIDRNRIFFDTVFAPFNNDDYYTMSVFIHVVCSFSLYNFLKRNKYNITEKEERKIKRDCDEAKSRKTNYHLSKVPPSTILEFINDGCGLPKGMDFFENLLTPKISYFLDNKIVKNLIKEQNVNFIDNAKLQSQNGIILLSNHPIIPFDSHYINEFIPCYTISRIFNDKLTFEENIQNHHIIPYYGHTQQYGYMVKTKVKKLIKRGNNILSFGYGRPDWDITKDSFKLKKGNLILAYEKKIKIGIINIILDKRWDAGDYFLVFLNMKDIKMTIFTKELVDPRDYNTFDSFYDYLSNCFNNIPTINV